MPKKDLLPYLSSKQYLSQYLKRLQYQILCNNFGPTPDVSKFSTNWNGLI